MSNRLTDVFSLDFGVFQAVTMLEPEQGLKWFYLLKSSMEEFNIYSKHEVIAFLSLIKTYTPNFLVTEESFDLCVSQLCEKGTLTYAQASMLGRHADENKVPPERQKAIANLLYHKRFGNNAADHGWKYRARGLLPLRGRFSYFQCGLVLGVNLIASPELVLTNTIAARSAAWIFRNQ